MHPAIEPEAKTASFTLTSKDLVQYGRYSLLHVNRVRNESLLRIVIVPVALVVVYWALKLDAVIAAPIVAILTIFWVGFVYWRTGTLTLKRAREYPAFFEPQFITIS